MIPTLRRSTAALLASSLLLTIGRGATLPFMTIYLTRQYQLEVDKIGYALSSALIVGVLFSMGFGILADKFDKKRYMTLAVLAFIGGFIAIPLVNSVALVVFFFALINCAYSVFSTVLKAWFADVLSPEKKAQIFSLNYTFLNIGWTVGPPIGTLLVMYSINLPFWLAAGCAALPLVFIQLFVQRTSAAIAEDNAVQWSPSVLLRDRALLVTRRPFLHSLARFFAWFRAVKTELLHCAKKVAIRFLLLEFVIERYAKNHPQPLIKVITNHLISLSNISCLNGYHTGIIEPLEVLQKKNICLIKSQHSLCFIK